MKVENSIEEDIILLKDFTEGNFKRDKLENYKGSYKMGYFYYKDIQQAIEHILRDYKRVLKENKKLHKEIDRMKSLDIYKLVEDWETGQLIPVQKIKNKIEEYEKRKSSCNDTESETRLDVKIKTYKELLEGRKI